MKWDISKTFAAIAIKSVLHRPAKHRGVAFSQMLLGIHDAKDGDEKSIVTDGGEASWRYNDNEKGMSLEVAYTRSGRKYRSVVQGAYLKDGSILDLKTLILDNHTEKLKNSDEIFSVFHAIGKQVQSIKDGKLPDVHIETPKFSPLGRLHTRIEPFLPYTL